MVVADDDTNDRPARGRRGRRQPQRRGPHDREVHAVRVASSAPRKPAVPNCSVPAKRAVRRRCRRHRATTQLGACRDPDQRRSMRTRSAKSARTVTATSGARHFGERRPGRAPRWRSPPPPNERAQPPSASGSSAAAQEAGRVEVAGAGRVDEGVDRMRGDHVRRVVRDDDATFSRAGQRGPRQSRRTASIAASNALVQRRSPLRSRSTSTSSSTRPAPLGPVALDAEESER